MEPLKITSEMMASRGEKVDKIIARVNNAIRRAVENDRHETVFDCDKDNENDSPFYDEVRRKFESAGYKIRPTGYSGGVWQRTENIYW